jgi:glycosyltransferase involved in cell wall biosynthesis
VMSRYPRRSWTMASISSLSTGRTRVERTFTWKRVADETLSLYRDMLE